MIRNLIILFVFFGTWSFGQSVHLDSFELKPSERFQNIQFGKMYFPIIRSGDKKIDFLINSDLKNRYTLNEYPTEPLDSALIKWADDGLITMEFEVTYNRNGILSLNISAEGCGAYCTYWTEYFNYSTVSGQWLEISQIIDTSGGFGLIVREELKLQYDEQKQVLMDWINDTESGLTIDDYDLVMEYYLESENTFNMKTFSLRENQLEIIETCWVPHVFLPLAPIIELKYNLGDIEEYLTRKY
jgi:hypothetical protein